LEPAFGRLQPEQLCFAVLFQYYRMIPSVYQFQVLGLTLSSKSFNYFFAVQVSFSEAPRTYPTRDSFSHRTYRYLSRQH
jgi:hypothetical protein